MFIACSSRSLYCGWLVTHVTNSKKLAALTNSNADYALVWSGVGYGRAKLSRLIYFPFDFLFNLSLKKIKGKYESDLSAFEVKRLSYGLCQFSSVKLFR